MKNSQKCNAVSIFASLLALFLWGAPSARAQGAFNLSADRLRLILDKLVEQLSPSDEVITKIRGNGRDYIIERSSPRDHKCFAIAARIVNVSTPEGFNVEETVDFPRIHVECEEKKSDIKESS